jgi:hypothetical protein
MKKQKRNTINYFLKYWIQRENIHLREGHRDIGSITEQFIAI